MNFVVLELGNTNAKNAIEYSKKIKDILISKKETDEEGESSLESENEK